MCFAAAAGAGTAERLQHWRHWLQHWRHWLAGTLHWAGHAGHGPCRAAPVQQRFTGSGATQAPMPVTPAGGEAGCACEPAGPGARVDAAHARRPRGPLHRPTAHGGGVTSAEREREESVTTLAVLALFRTIYSGPPLTSAACAWQPLPSQPWPWPRAPHCLDRPHGQRFPGA